MAPSDSAHTLAVPPFARGEAIWYGFGTRKLTWSGLKAQAARRGLIPVSLQQQHGDRLVRVEAAEDFPCPGDGLFTDRSGFLLVIKTADCLPVLLAEPQAGVVAAVHCGWRGTSQRILWKAVRFLKEKLGCRAERMQAALGPCIAASCYEVGREVLEAFAGEGMSPELFKERAERPDKVLFDLREANRRQLREAGVPGGHIFSLSGCTHCQKNLYSYRRDAQEAGRLLNFIGRIP